MHLVQQKKPDYKQARTMLKKACDQMLLQACTFLGNLSEFGRGTKKDKKQAMALYEKACKGGDEMGCRAKKGGVDIIKEIQSPPAPPPDASGAVPPPPPAGSEAPPPPPPPK